MAPANGLAFSCRERAGRCLQNANDLAREAVSCNAGLGRSGRLICTFQPRCSSGMIAQNMSDQKGIPMIPLPIQIARHAAYRVMAADGLHRLSAIRRRRLYEAFGCLSGGGKLLQGHLAIITAKRVLPVVQQAPYPKEDVYEADLQLPEQLIAIAQAILAGRAEANEASRLISRSHESFSLLLTEAHYDPERFPMNAGYAAFAAMAAVEEVMGFDRYQSMDIAAKARWQRRGTPELVLTDPVTEAEFELDWGDTAGFAEFAAACGVASSVCEPEQREAFWEWWLHDALLQAWEYVAV
jgi:hypothetical protein